MAPPRDGKTSSGRPCARCRIVKLGRREDVPAAISTGNEDFAILEQSGCMILSRLRQFTTRLETCGLEMDTRGEQEKQSENHCSERRSMPDGGGGMTLSLHRVSESLDPLKLTRYSENAQQDR